MFAAIVEGLRAELTLRLPDVIVTSVTSGSRISRVGIVSLREKFPTAFITLTEAGFKFDGGTLISYENPAAIELLLGEVARLVGCPEF